MAILGVSLPLAAQGFLVGVPIRSVLVVPIHCVVGVVGRAD